MHDRLTSFQDPGDYDLPFPGRMRGAGGGAPRCLSSALGNIQRKISHAAHEIILSGDLGSFAATTVEPLCGKHGGFFPSLCESICPDHLERT